MRRELIALLHCTQDSESLENVYEDLVETGGKVLSTDQNEDEVASVEVGRGELKVSIPYTPWIAEVEDRISAARFRNKIWNVRRTTRNDFQMTLTLERS